MVLMAHSCRSRSDRPVASGLQAPPRAARLTNLTLTRAAEVLPVYEEKLRSRRSGLSRVGQRNSRSHTVVKRDRIEDPAAAWTARRSSSPPVRCCCMPVSGREQSPVYHVDTGSQCGDSTLRCGFRKGGRHATLSGVRGRRSRCLPPVRRFRSWTGRATAAGQNRDGVSTTRGARSTTVINVAIPSRDTVRRDLLLSGVRYQRERERDGTGNWVVGDHPRCCEGRGAWEIDP